MSVAPVFKKSIEFSNLISISASGLNFVEGNVPYCFTHAAAFLAIASSQGGFFGLQDCLGGDAKCLEKRNGDPGFYTWYGTAHILMNGSTHPPDCINPKHENLSRLPPSFKHPYPLSF